MVYRLVLYKGKTIKIIDFSKVPGFEKMRNNSLFNIYSFTSQFMDGYDLLNSLVSARVISKEDCALNIGIAKYPNKNDSPIILPYGINVASEKEYFEPSTLRLYLVKHLPDEDFMNLFIERYYDRLKQNPYLWEDINYIHHAFRYYQKNHNFPESTDEYINHFIEYFCYYRTSKKVTFNNSNIRDLAMFIINYERLKEKEELQAKKDNIINEIAWYNNIFRENNITDEDRSYYEEKINELEGKLGEIDEYTRRKKKHETT